MAIFDEAYRITGNNEGGISNAAGDHGRFTYAGIASVFWPNWSGWPTVHDVLASHNGSVKLANEELANNLPLQQMVANFYRVNFWDANKLDQFNDQQLANSVYDFGVNSGTGKAAKILQMAVNTISDGIIGPQTINAINVAKEPDLYNQYNEMRRLFYENLATHPGQHQFLASWLSRLKPYQS